MYIQHARLRSGDYAMLGRAQMTMVYGINSQGIDGGTRNRQETDRRNDKQQDRGKYVLPYDEMGGLTQR